MAKKDRAKEIITSLEERKANAMQAAKGKIFIKLAVFLIACITASIICGVSMKSVWFWLIPAVVGLVPIALGTQYAYLIRKGLLAGQIMQITEKKKARLEGLFLKSSLTQKRFTFLYRDQEGFGTFSISRGGIINTMTAGQTYLVLTNANRKPGEDNFIEFTQLDMTAEEKERLFG